MRAGLSRIGFDPARFAPEDVAPGRWLGRVIEQHRAHLLVDDGETAHTAIVAPWLKRPREGAHARPAVGDWVLLEPADGDVRPMVAQLLPRHSALTRGAAGDRYARQTLAANVDVVMVVVGLDRDFNVRRIERYFALISASGATPWLVLTKADRVDDADEVRERLTALFPAAEVHAVNAKDRDSVAALSADLHEGLTVVLVGSSGAGKSTLTNTLLGELRQATGAVRASDERGRHTTVHRSLLRLASGACLIDTPGLREIKLTGDEPEDLSAFDDIEALAADCRFRDCRHEHEPGCAVQAAVEAGEISAARLASFRKLKDEREAAEARALAAERMKAQRQRRAPGRSDRGGRS
ncbi:MAG: ribosome small subunit-dependent GTPase A [Xanthomonadales bacterium]|nr:ribosome small subunit-dependent GTPase A [Xanthomonadales bacterium]